MPFTGVFNVPCVFNVPFFICMNVYQIFFPVCVCVCDQTYKTKIQISFSVHDPTQSIIYFSFFFFISFCVACVCLFVCSVCLFPFVCCCFFIFPFFLIHPFFCVCFYFITRSLIHLLIHSPFFCVFVYKIKISFD